MANTAEVAAAEAERVGGRVVIKVQIAAGKRGKGGGIRFASDGASAAEAATAMLGSTVNGHPVRSLLIERAVPIEREFYAAVMNDPTTGECRLLFSTDGGMEIEEVPAARIAQALQDIRSPLPLQKARALLLRAGDERLIEQLAHCFVALYELYREYDAELVEINPLAVTPAGEVVALDCKLVIDDSSRKQHEELFARVTGTLGEQGTELERRARAQGLLYMELDGDIGILANGAGLTMTTMDVVAHYGGRAANFMEIGGDAYTKATPAMEIVLANPRVRSLLINFCRAFAQTDVMARGVADAIATLKPSLPMTFSIHGTGAEAAIKIVREELGIEPLTRWTMRCAPRSRPHDSTGRPPVLVQGMTGKQATFWSERMREAGTGIVAVPHPARAA